jgi:iron-sulfur cluster assembly accessory protein
VEQIEMTASKVTVGGGAAIISEAAEKFMRRMVRFGGSGSGFRLVVSPGGCSGLSAEFTIEESPKPGDETFSVNGLKVYVPGSSATLLAGVTVDFVDTATQTGLTFFSPDAPASCGDSARPPMVPLSSLTTARQ